MAYKVLNIFKDLPNTNCGDCGRSGCFAFATVVYLEGEPLANCPHLEPEKLAEMQAKLDEGRGQGDGKKEALYVQALKHLTELIATLDFEQMSKNCDAAYVPGPPEALEVPFLGKRHRVTVDEVVALEGEAPSVWVKVFLYIYATRANGADPRGRWIAFRELPNSVSKSQNFEAAAQEVAKFFSGKMGELEKSVKAIGGVDAEFGSADRAWRIQALPRVELMLLFWDATEEFEARSSVLIDAGALDYLDQEALVFLVEALSQRLTGKSVNEVLP